MYEQIAPVTIKSASLLYNNFDALEDEDDSKKLFAVVHKSMLCIVKPNATNNHVAYVVCKGETTHSSEIILQGKWCVLPQRTLLVVASLKGIQMYEPDGSNMIFWQALPPNPTEGVAQFGRGITAVGSRHICVGSADGSIRVFDVPAKGSSVKLQETLSVHETAVTDLHAFQDHMVSADDSGNIILWLAGGHFEKQKTISGSGYPCASIRIWKKFIVGGYGSGHVRVYNADTGVIIAEIAAHAKWINAIDIAEACGLLVTTSEDSYIRVWNLYDFDLLYQASAGDVQLTGVRFLDPNGSSFGVTGYDSSDVLVYQKS